METHELLFDNRDAGRKTVVHVSAPSVATVMQLYGAFCAGDHYTVLLDGKKVEKDENGCLLGELPL